jgi:hypothetical protein
MNMNSGSVSIWSVPRGARSRSVLARCSMPYERHANSQSSETRQLFSQQALIQESPDSVEKACTFSYNALWQIATFWNTRTSVSQISLGRLLAASIRN